MKKRIFALLTVISMLLLTMFTASCAVLVPKDNGNRAEDEDEDEDEDENDSSGINNGDNNGNSSFREKNGDWKKIKNKGCFVCGVPIIFL